MITTEDLDRLERDALATIKIKTEAAFVGHDHVVDSHSMNSFKLLELVALARRGYHQKVAEERARHGMTVVGGAGAAR
jgi:hypothetical protein